MHHRLLPLALLALVPLPAAAQQEDFVWTYNRYVEPNPINTYLGLVYGIPETDALQVSISCSIGANWVYSAIDLGMDVDGFDDQATASVALSVNGYSATEEGNVFRHEEGIWGVALAEPLDSPLWQAMAAGGTLTYGIAGRAPMTLSLDGIAQPLQAYLADCWNIGDLKPDNEGEPVGK